MFFNHPSAFAFSNLRPLSTPNPSSLRSPTSRHSVGGSEGLVWSSALKPSLQLPTQQPQQQQQQQQVRRCSYSGNQEDIDLPVPAAAQPERQRRDRRHVRTSFRLVMEQLAVCDQTSNTETSVEAGATQQEPTVFLLHPANVSNGQGEYPLMNVMVRSTPSPRPMELELQTEEPEIPLPSSMASRGVTSNL